MDAGVLWLGAGLTAVASVLLAYVPRLPSTDQPAGLGLAGGSVRMTPATSRRLQLFATTQIACSFVLLAGAGMLIATLNSQQTAKTGYDMRHVLAIDVPPSATGYAGPAMLDFFQEATPRVGALPGVEGVAAGMVVPWRDPSDNLKFQFEVEGYERADGEDNPTVRFRPVSPGFFAVLGVPILAGRDFTDADHQGTEPVAIVSQTMAQRLFPNGEALHPRPWFATPRQPKPRRVRGLRG